MQNENQVESKRERIEELLQEGRAPEEIAELVDCTSRYVYHIKAQVVGVKEHTPSTKDHITDIKERLELMGKDVHKIAMSEEIFMILCPSCGEPFDSSYEDSVICLDCNILFCSELCIKKHKEEGFFDDQSKCQEYKAKVSELIGDDTPAPEEHAGNKEPESIETQKVKESDKDDFW